MDDQPDISSADFEAARAAIRKLGDDYEVNQIEQEIIDLQMHFEYHQMLDGGTLKAVEIRRRIRKKFGCGDGRIRHVVYKKF